MMIKLYLLAAAALLTVAAPLRAIMPVPAPPRPEPELIGGAAARTLVDAERAFARMSVERGAVAAWTAFFTPDGVQLAADQPPIHGREAIVAWLKTSGMETAGMTLDWWPLRAEVAAGGDMGYTFGEWEFRTKDAAPDAKPMFRGKFISVWKKQVDGTWKIIVDAGNEYPETKP